MEIQTDIPVKYENLTPEEKKEVCNGCGGKGGWIKPPHRAFFNTSCNHHDYGYWKGCTDAHRLVADKALHDSMVQDCTKLAWYNKLRYRPWCEAYYIGVRLSGSNYFYYGTKQRFPKREEVLCVIPV